MLVDLITKGTVGIFNTTDTSVTVEVLLETPEKFKALEAPTSKPTVTIFLYRVAVNSETRNSPRRTFTNGVSTRPSLPLELSYFVTPWAREPRAEHRLAGCILQTLYDHSELGRRDLIGTSWSEDDSVQLILETLPTTEHYQIWETTKLPYRLSLTYMARVIGIEPKIAITSSPIVETVLGRRNEPGR